MKDFFKHKLAYKYIFFELLPSFILGVIVFILILLMFQALRLTEFILVHGVTYKTILSLMVYLSISFLPVIIPMSLLFSILLTYGRFSNDSEIIAMKAVGINFYSISLPAFILAGFACFFSAQTSFNIGPWGNRQFEVTIGELQKMKTSASIKAGVFSEGFFDMVVYANEIDSKNDVLKKVFIFDERDPKTPLTIIAQQGIILKDPDRPNQRSTLNLIDGSIHKTNSSAYTKIDFETYKVNLFENISSKVRQKSILSYKMFEINRALENPNLKPKKRKQFEIELHRRWALSLACLVFALAGVAFGTVTNKRNAKSGGMIVCIGLIVLYWILYVAFEGVAKNGHLPPAIAIWLPNIIFLGLSYNSFKKAIH